MGSLFEKFFFKINHLHEGFVQMSLDRNLIFSRKGDKMIDSTPVPTGEGTIGENSKDHIGELLQRKSGFFLVLEKES